MSRTTVKKYLSRFKESGMGSEQVLGLSDRDLSCLLQDKEPPVVNDRLAILEKLLPTYCKRLKRKGVTREILYREYKERHPEGYSRFRYTTNPEHLASHHRAYTEWNAEKFIAEATAIHKDVGSYITKVIESKSHPEQAYKSVMGILSFARRVGEKRLINACRWADSYGLYSYPAVETILNNRQDEIPLEEDVPEDKFTPEHKNIRGKDYYQ